MADVFSKAITANSTKNGSVVTTALRTGGFQKEQSRAVSGVSESTLDDRFTERFDDPTYYGGGGLIKGLVGYFKLDETSGPRENIMGRGLAGRITTMTDNNTVGSLEGHVSRSGSTGVAANFIRGNSEYLSVAAADVDGLNPGAESFTLSAWVYINSASQYVNQNIYGLWKSSGNQRSYKLWYDGGTQKLRFYYSQNGTSSLYLATTGAISADTWYQSLIRYDGATLGFYIDNSSADSIAGVSTLYSSSADFILGGTADASNYLNGRLDNLALWERALTDEEMASLYNSGAGTILR